MLSSSFVSAPSSLIPTHGIHRAHKLVIMITIILITTKEYDLETIITSKKLVES